MYKFYEWALARLLKENISFPEALGLFDYKPGDLIDALDYKKRLGRLTMMHHPDRGGNHNDMVRVNLANEILKPFIGHNIPGGSTPPSEPKPQPSPPEPEPKPQHWADESLHGATKQVFGKWLHVGMMKLLEESERYQKFRDTNKLFDGINHLSHLLIDMKHAFNEWHLRTREHMFFNHQDFDDLLESLELRDESAKGMRLVLKNFRQRLVGPFYNKYIKDFTSF